MPQPRKRTNPVATDNKTKQRILSSFMQAQTTHASHHKNKQNIYTTLEKQQFSTTSSSSSSSSRMRPTISETKNVLGKNEKTRAHPHSNKIELSVGGVETVCLLPRCLGDLREDKSSRTRSTLARILKYRASRQFDPNVPLAFVKIIRIVFKNDGYDCWVYLNSIHFNVVKELKRKKTEIKHPNK